MKTKNMSREGAKGAKDSAILNPQSSIQNPQLQQAVSTRTYRALFRLKLTTRKNIERAIKNRTLHPENVQALGFGEKGLAQVRDWLGLKPALTSQQICHARAHCAAVLLAQGFNLRDIGRILRMGKVQAERHVAKQRTIERRAVKIHLKQPFSYQQIS